jgi:hypothetical protein
MGSHKLFFIYAWSQYLLLLCVDCDVMENFVVQFYHQRNRINLESAYLC